MLEIHLQSTLTTLIDSFNDHTARLVEFVVSLVQVPTYKTYNTDIHTEIHTTQYIRAMLNP